MVRHGIEESTISNTRPFYGRTFLQYNSVVPTTTYFSHFVKKCAIVNVRSNEKLHLNCESCRHRHNKPYLAISSSNNLLNELHNRSRRTFIVFFFFVMDKNHDCAFGVCFSKSTRGIRPESYSNSNR